MTITHYYPIRLAVRIFFRDRNYRPQTCLTQTKVLAVASLDILGVCWGLEVGVVGVRVRDRYLRDKREVDPGKDPEILKHAKISKLRKC